MLDDNMCKCEKVLSIDGNPVRFSLAGEGTKVSPHDLHALLGLIV